MTACAKCHRPIDDDADAHQAHDEDCARFLAGSCLCDGWLCAACCPDSACVTPLAARLQLLNHDHQRAHIRAAEGDAA